jgi:hypothetical protein
LFWGNAKGNGDGTVACQRATDARAASKAIKVCRYNEDHAGMLGNGGDATAAGLLKDFKTAVENIVQGAANPVCADESAVPPCPDPASAPQ